MRRAGSPVQPSSMPRIAKSTPARLRTDAMERATLWLRCSRAAVQPTQNSTSASGWSASIGMSKPSAQSVRVKVVPRQGCPRCSMLSRAFMAVSGISAFSMTRKRRISTMVLMCSTPTGHSSTQAPQVRQSHSASSGIQRPMRGFSACSSSPSMMPGAVSSTCSFRFSTMCMGERILPLMFAGQTSVQRPQTAQA